MWREGLWKKMKEYGEKESLIDVCKALYEDVQSCVVLDGEHSRWFGVGDGVRQGCRYYIVYL